MFAPRPATKKKWGKVHRKLHDILSITKSKEKNTEDLQKVLKEIADSRGKRNFIKKTPAVIDVISKMFHFIDRDGGGDISVVEFMTTLRVIGQKLGEGFRHPSPMALFAKIDIDQGGTVNCEELIDGIVKENDQIFMNICYALQACAAEHSGASFDVSDTYSDISNLTQQETEKALREMTELYKLHKEEAEEHKESAIEHRREAEKMRIEVEAHRAEIFKLRTDALQLQKSSPATDALNKKVQSLRRSHDATQQNLSNAEKTIVSLRKEIKNLEGTIARFRNQAVTERNLRRRSLTTTEAFELRGQQILDLQQKLASSEANAELLKKEMHSKSADIRSLKIEITRLSGRLLHAQARLEGDSQQAKRHLWAEKHVALKLQSERIISLKTALESLKNENNQLCKQLTGGEAKRSRPKKLQKMNEALLLKIERMENTHAKVSRVVVALEQKW